MSKIPTPEEIKQLQDDLAASVEARGKAEGDLKAAESRLAEQDGQITQLKEQLAAVSEDRDSARSTVSARVSDLEAMRQELEEAKAASAGKPAKQAKPKVVNVVSATDFNYDLGDGLKATPDIPVKAERYPGNLLDGLMEAGLVKEYEG